MPSNRTRRVSLNTSRTTARTAWSRGPPLASMRVRSSWHACATAALRMVIGHAQLALEPTARNSNLLPVNANGVVRLRSVISRRAEILLVTFIWVRSPTLCSEPSATADTIASRAEPRYNDMIAGGASLAPSRCSLPDDAIVDRIRSLWTSIARRTAARVARNRRLCCGSVPGSRRFSPVFVARLQLLCLPLPLTPANGFSWSRQARPWRSATRRSVSMTSPVISRSLGIRDVTSPTPSSKSSAKPARERIETACFCNRAHGSTSKM